MTTVAVLARLALALVFVVSAVTKLRDRSGFRTAVDAFGVPAAAAPAVAAALPYLELVCALLLVLAAPAATLGAAGAALLLLAFTVAIVINLRQGKHPDCHCFGQLGSSRIGWPTVARNVALLVITAVGFADTGPSVAGELSAHSGRELAVGAAIALLLAVIAGMAGVLYALTTRYGALLLRLESLEQATGLAPRPVAPEFALPDLNGEVVALDDVLADGRPALVAFISPSCDMCSELLPDLERWQQDPEHPLAVLAVSDGSLEDNRAKLAATPALRVVVQHAQEVATAYGVDGTPAAFVVDVNGTLAAPAAYAVGPIRELHDRLASQLTHPVHTHDHGLHQIEQRPVAPGDPLPDVTVGVESGEQVQLADLAADRGVLLFWRTDCSFCAAVTDDVAALESSTRVLLVTGTPEDAVRASGLVSPLVREQDDALTDALKIPGTPSAVRVRDGVIDSVVAVGGPQVLALLSESAAQSRRSA